MRLPFQAPPTLLMALVVIALLISTKLAEAQTACLLVHSCLETTEPLPLR